MIKYIRIAALTFGLLSLPPAVAKTLRAPATPLITIDPYTSCWSMTDHLYDDATRHWTSAEMPLIGVLKVDGRDYRFMGKETPILSTLVETAETSPWQGRYLTTKPSGQWWHTDYNDSDWPVASGAFGSMPQERLARTAWDTDEIWVRRVVDLPAVGSKPIYLNYSHDDDVIIYINGIKVVDTGNQCHKNVRLLLEGKARESLHKGQNIIAAWCRDRGGLSFIDFGLEIEQRPSRQFVNTAVQTAVKVDPTNTYYTFTCGPVDLKLTFTAPALLDSLSLLSRPVGYISYDITSRDGRDHNISLYFEAGRQFAIDNISQESVSTVADIEGLTVATTASVSQDTLARSGDDLRIDWGTFYLATTMPGAKVWVGDSKTARRAWASGGKTITKSNSANTDIGLTINAGHTNHAKGFIMAAYDDGKSIQYFGTNLRPYWNRNGTQTIAGQMLAAAYDYDAIMAAATAFDSTLIETATATGGEEYAALCALAYRQAIAAHKLVESPQGDLLWLSKENFSNGSIGTVDITYPSAPLFLLYNPELVKGLMNHIFYYSESAKWPKPFAAHDVGTYPKANGQTYGGDMPVEESGNMLILCAALAKIEGNADYAARHWNALSTWTDYLCDKGLDPENQLCTDDFAGHFAHNANLSIKAIEGIASYALLAKMLGKENVAARYETAARKMAAQWVKMADDGDHYRLTFDKPGTWSQKYNLVWDQILGLNIFPKSVAEKEIAYYLTKQNRYGLPLDNRETYTKTDWIMWTATMAPDKDTFSTFIVPVFDFMCHTRHRVPMSDWVYTDRADQRGFQARAVVGGYYMKMLADRLAAQQK